MLALRASERVSLFTTVNVNSKTVSSDAIGVAFAGRARSDDEFPVPVSFDP